MASQPPRFEDVRVPTLLVLGERSYLPYDHLLDAHRAALGDLLEVVVVPGGHTVLWDALDETAEAIAAFLEPLGAELGGDARRRSRRSARATRRRPTRPRRARPRRAARRARSGCPRCGEQRRVGPERHADDVRLGAEDGRRMPAHGRHDLRVLRDLERLARDRSADAPRRSPGRPRRARSTISLQLLLRELRPSRPESSGARPAARTAPDSSRTPDRPR